MPRPPLRTLHWHLKELKPKSQLLPVSYKAPARLSPLTTHFSPSPRPANHIGVIGCFSLQCDKPLPTSGPLHLLCPVPGVLFLCPTLQQLQRPLLREALLTTHPKEKDPAWGVQDCSSHAWYNVQHTVRAQNTRAEGCLRPKPQRGVKEHPPLTCSPG